MMVAVAVEIDEFVVADLDGGGAFDPWAGERLADIGVGAVHRVGPGQAQIFLGGREGFILENQADAAVDGDERGVDAIEARIEIEARRGEILEIGCRR